MGTSQRIDLAGNKTHGYKPGPGNYEHIGDMKKTAPSFGFGSEIRPNIARSGKNASPAPGNYEPKKIVGADGPSVTMSPKLNENFKEKHDKLVPGPGNYEFHLKAMKTAPNYGFGTSVRQDPGRTGTKGVVTEPGGYNPGTTYTKTSSPNYRFGSDVRKDVARDKNDKLVPGPGNYEMKSKAFDSKTRGYMGIKISDQSKMVVPGAGTYEPDPSPVKNKASSYSMGAKLKSDLIRSAEVPGPGTYVNSAEKFKQSAPSFGFGSSKRPEMGNKKQNTPGPGSYKVPSKIADVPSYSYQKKDDSKYI